MTTPASNNRFKGVSFQPQATPSTPASGDGRLFLDTADGLLKWIDDAGVVTEVALGSGSGLSDPMTTRGDIIYRDAANATARLGRGTAGQVLTSDGTDIGWDDPAGGGAMATDALWDAAGDLAVGTGANTGANLPIGTEGQYLAVASGTPAWTSPTQYVAPRLSNQASNYSASTTSLVLTMTAPSSGDNLVCVVFATGRGANSITQTNVTWTQRYTVNGNSQYFEIWTGAVSGSAGTTATVALTGANKTYAETFVVDSVPAFTSASLVGSSFTGTGAQSGLSVTQFVSAGDYIICGISANSPAAGYGTLTQPFVTTGGSILGGAGWMGLFRVQANLACAVWRTFTSSVAYVGAFVKVS